MWSSVILCLQIQHVSTFTINIVISTIIIIISPHLLLVTFGAARGLVSDEEDLTELH